MKRRKTTPNQKFNDSLYLNSETYYDYLNRFRRIALSMFEWVNLPKTMNSRYLEECLFFNGQASLLYDKKYGFINTKCAGNGYVNIYGLPSKLHCFSYDFQTDRDLYVGLNEVNPSKKEDECILVMNNWDRTPTAGSMELFAYRLYLAQRTCDVNISSQRYPVMVIGDEKQRLMLQNLYSQYDGNKPVIFGDKHQLDGNVLKAISTEAPY
ncbi:MAG: hypothetical protein J6W64_03925, partial [Bacilli bacterium]|nr:hypothetical protein [Bacilli bacterium]